MLYSLFGVAGAYALDELKTLRKFGSRFEGHPTPKFKYAEAATGSLGQGLSKLGEQNKEIYALDGDVMNSTFTEAFKKAHPDRFVECYIAEQNMVSVAAGLSRFGKIPFVVTFAAFLTRAADQIRMARVSEADIKFIGSHWV